MLDDDIKKLLHDLKMDDVVSKLEGKVEAAQHEEKIAPEPKPAPKPEPVCAPQHVPTPLPVIKPFPKRAALLASLLILILVPTAYFFWPAAEQADSLIAYNDDEDAEEEEETTLQQEREASAASWATKIVQMDGETGASIQLLWDMLRRRKEDLEEVAQGLTELLYDNARLREDFYSKNASALLMRYQAIDRRHSVGLANQINAIYAQIKEKNNKELSRAYAEMLGELGAETYSKHHLQIAKELIEQDLLCQDALHAVVSSTTLADLEQNLEAAQHLGMRLQNSGMIHTVQQEQEYASAVVGACKDALDALLVPGMSVVGNRDERRMLEKILDRLAVGLPEIHKYLQKFDTLANPSTSEVAAKRVALL